MHAGTRARASAGAMKELFARVRRRGLYKDESLIVFIVPKDSE